MGTSQVTLHTDHGLPPIPNRQGRRRASVRELRPRRTPRPFAGSGVNQVVTPGYQVPGKNQEYGVANTRLFELRSSSATKGPTKTMGLHRRTMAPGMKVDAPSQRFREHHMPPRPRPLRVRGVAQAGRRKELPSSVAMRRTNARPAETTTEHWRRAIRPRLVRDLVSATESLRWSPTLVAVLLEELYADYDIEKLLASAPRQLQDHQFPQAVALAVILRHSWRADDLASILERLGLSDTISQ